MYCFRKRHLWGSKLHAGYSIPLCFYLEWSGFCDEVKKFVSGLIIVYDRRGWLLRCGFGVVPAIIFHCNVVPVVKSKNIDHFHTMHNK